MRTIKTLFVASLFLGILPIACPAFGAVKEADKLAGASAVLEKITAIPEQSIPPALLNNAHGLAVIPRVFKAGFVVGGSYGKGVLTVRDKDGRWSAPLFVTLRAGSVGWQIGAQSTDLLLVFKTAKSVEGILKGTFTLGADAAVAAGPVGRRGEAATDAELKAEILSYSRSRGLFAGVSLQGASIRIDHASNKNFYGKEVSPKQILAGGVSIPPAGQKFLGVVSNVTAAK
ncbi:MAG: lipid-binding SYLF domain-containing protein [Thiobacillaceae bacterium]